MKALRTLLGNLAPYRLRFALVFLAGIADGAVTFYIPLALSRFTRGEFQRPDFLRLTGLLGGLFLLSLSLQWVIRRYGELLGTQIGFLLRRKYFDAIEELPAEKLAENHSGYLLSLVSAVSDSLGGLAIEMFWGWAKSLATVVIFFWATARESAPIALFNAAVLVVFIAVTSKLARQMVPLTNKAAVLRAALFGRYADVMANVLTVKKLGIAGFAAERIASDTAAAEAGVVEVQRFHARRWFILHFLFGLAYIATIAAVLHALVSDREAVSILILVVGAYAIIRSLVERLSENYRQLIEITGYLDTLEPIVALNSTNPSAPALPDWKTINLSAIHFSYPGLERELVYQDFRLEPGDRVFVSGPSGAGKTTLLNLIAGFFPLRTGHRTIGGNNYGAGGPPPPAGMFLLVAQEAELFNLSIRENLTLGKQISDEVIENHLARLDLLDWVRSHSQGLSAVVGEKGIKVSAGQKQRLNLIRGIFLDRGVCLLDEPTAHMDQRTEELVADYLDQELRGRTAVIVSHRPALKRLCSKFYTIENGILSAVRGEL